MPRACTSSPVRWRRSTCSTSRTRPRPAATGCSATEPEPPPMDIAPPRLLLVSPPFDAEDAAAQLDAVLAAAGAADAGVADVDALLLRPGRSEEHTSELQSLMRISYAVFCLKKKTPQINKTKNNKINIIKYNN